MMDLPIRCREVSGFLDRVPLNDEYGAGMAEVSLAKKTLMEAADALEEFAWRPIETAPQDGTRVIVYDGNSAYSAQFSNGRWILSPEAWEGDGWNGMLVDAPGTPTRWMPLPAVSK